MKKSELRSLILEVIEEERLTQTQQKMGQLASDMRDSQFHGDFLDNAAKLLQLASGQLSNADYAMSDLGPDGVEITKDVNEPDLTRTVVQGLKKEVDYILTNPVLSRRK